MAAYSFKREANLYIVYAGLQYNIDISDISFSQTIQEESYQAKTIQSQSQFERSVIHKANPVNFEFTLSAIRENDFLIVFNRGLDCLPFDIYIETLQDVFKIEIAVITNVSFLTPRNGILGLGISGQASKLSRVGNYGYTIPGSVQTRANSITYNLTKYLDIELSATSIGTDIVSLTTELQNNIRWLPNSIITGTCDPATELLYPTEFIIENKILSGNITRYLRDDNNSFVQQWSQDTTLYIEVGQQVGQIVYGFIFNISNCSFTNRVAPNEVYVQSYDWRMIQSPDSLFEVISYVTLEEGEEQAILDYLNQPILDSNNSPILEST